MITSKNMKGAQKYFSALKADEVIEPGTKDASNYTRYIQIAGEAAERLTLYGHNGLKILDSNGFSVPESVLVGTSQESVSLAEIDALQEGIFKTDSNLIEQAERVLGLYIEILPWEERVENYRKLKAVDEVMKISRR